MRYPWSAAGLCFRKDPDTYYPEKGAKGGIGVARDVCAQCPVRHECLDASLDLPANLDQGIWGGSVERQRRRWRRAGGVESAAVRDQIRRHHDILDARGERLRAGRAQAFESAKVTDVPAASSPPPTIAAAG